MPIFKKLKLHKILLDTHVWIWLMMGDERLSKPFIKSIEQASAREEVFVSAISIWEIGMLVERGRITLEMDCLDWVKQALDSPGISLIPITPEIAIQSSRLPDNSHGDPADRLIMATAFENKAILVTHDQKIIMYGKGQFIDVFDPI